MRVKAEYQAVVSVDVDLATGEVSEARVRAPEQGEHSFDLSVGPLDDEAKAAMVREAEAEEAGERDELADGSFDLALKVVDAAAPFQIAGWWAPGSEQRFYARQPDERDEDAHETDDSGVPLREPPPMADYEPPPYASAYGDVLPLACREALKTAGIVYVDECFHALEQTRYGESLAEEIGYWLPERYAKYYDHGFGRKWVATVLSVSQRLAEPRRIRMATVAEELALNALIGEAKVHMEMSDQPVDEDAWEEFFETVFEDTDFEVLFSRQLDGLEDDKQLATQMAMANLSFDSWFIPFNDERRVAPFTSSS